MAKKNTQIEFYEAVGRRKEAVAVVRLYIVNKDKTATVGGQKLKEGTITINGKTAEEFFPSLAEQKKYLQPFEQTNTTGRFAVSIKVQGGGKNGQVEAIVLGIARSLQIVDKELYTAPLKVLHLLSRDPRIRERRKVGTGGKARRKKQSPKR